MNRTVSISPEDIESATKEALEYSDKNPRKFVETIDVIVNLKNVNLKDPANRFNNEFELPNPVDPNPSICFFVEGDQLVEANKLGEDAMDVEQMEQISKGEKSQRRNFVKKYDFFIASTQMMRHVAKNFGRLFGPRGKMPRPQPQGYGVISPSDSVADSRERYKKIIRLRLTKFPLIQFKVGTKEMPLEVIMENTKAALDFIENKLDKGRQQLKSIYIKTTMGKPARVL